MIWLENLEPINANYTANYQIETRPCNLNHLKQQEHHLRTEIKRDTHKMRRKTSAKNRKTERIQSHYYVRSKLFLAN
jgi:hypothetical protein